MIAVLAVILVAGALGLGSYFVSSYYYDVIDEQDRSIYVTPVPVSTAETMQEDSSYGQTGIYGLWYQDNTDTETEDEVYHPQEDLWMGDFVDTRERVDAKGIYVSSSYLSQRFDKALDLVKRTELNAMVIDVKSDYGYITFDMDCDLAKEIGANTSTIADINATIAELKENNIYCVARIVSMVDPVLAKARPDLAVTRKDGTMFYDSDKKPWLNPYKQEVWDYLTEIARQCILVGFDEVNFDYIRFSTGSGMSEVDFGPEAETRSKVDVITDGLRGICEVIKPMGGFVSCDVYGAIITSNTDAKIVGQNYFRMAQYVDYICPMIYPSHYGDGYYNLDYPDTHPYELIYHALQDSKKVLYMIDTTGNKADVRPWLQDFTATWVKHHIVYGKEEVRAQIDAVYDTGYSSWLLWNAAINYTENALEKAE